jgi:phosphoethanolamine N-methyltransferase
METFSRANEERNGAKYSNITFICADVTTLDFPEGTFDFVFSNWLMMYLTDEEVQSLHRFPQ